jgi:hypothetical protein
VTDWIVKQAITDYNTNPSKVMVHSWSNYFISENIQLLQLKIYCHTGNKYVFIADKLYLFMVNYHGKQEMYSRVSMSEINQE